MRAAMRAVAVAALASPLLLWSWGAPRVADRLGVIAGAWIGEAARALAPGVVAEREASSAGAPPVPADDAVGFEVEGGDLPPAVVRGSRVTRAPARIRGIRVRAATVLRLATAGARPSATPVVPAGARPAGLALVGVTGLGVGVLDGDVLTEVGGAPATSVVAVVSAVVAARRAHSPAIGGRFWRDGEPWQLVVEMPYVEPPPPSDGGT